MIQAVAAELIGQFAEARRADITRSQAPVMAPDAGTPPPASPPPPAPRPIGGFGLIWRVVMRWISGLLRR